VMTVSTVVAGLLPIMWSTSSGSEVMKPLATPVLGGMVSSLLHVLVVTPVIFYSLHERRLRRGEGATPPTATGEEAAGAVEAEGSGGEGRRREEIGGGRHGHDEEEEAVPH
jgi:hypothetical protein